jgi:SulP family sulfate permease
MKQAGKKDDKKLARATGSVLRLVPLLLAASVAGPQPWLSAGCLLLLWLPMEWANVWLTGLSYLVLRGIAAHCGRLESVLLAALYVALVAGILLAWRAARLQPLLKKIKAPKVVRKVIFSVLWVGAAALMTLYQCGGYFGLHIPGESVPALLRAYHNLGFHPNWRTVLYSTIMMVVLIAWPRKFKQLSKILPAGFVGVVAVTLLNILLNPLAARSTVQELGIAWLPVVNRLPTSALSMLLIYTAWTDRN